nr:hypothetical protein [Oribacterium asaccharolyticum]
MAKIFSLDFSGTILFPLSFPAHIIHEYSKSRRCQRWPNFRRGKEKGEKDWLYRRIDLLRKKARLFFY